MMYGRSVRQLLVVWGTALVSLVVTYRLEQRIPALHEMLLPVYWVIFGAAAWFTWRWARGRSRGDRRGPDRRNEDRRGEGKTGVDG
jgi:hypothetical protein